MHPFGAREAVARVEAAQFGERRASDLARAVGGAVERRIVEDHDRPVRRRVHVEFQVIGAGGETAPESLERVLGGERRAAAMGEQARARCHPSHMIRPDSMARVAGELARG